MGAFKNCMKNSEYNNERMNQHEDMQINNSDKMKIDIRMSSSIRIPKGETDSWKVSMLFIRKPFNEIDT